MNSSLPRLYTSLKDSKLILLSLFFLGSSIIAAAQTTVDAITKTAADPNDGSITLTWDVTFGASVTGVTNANFVANTTGTMNVAALVIGGSGTAWTVSTTLAPTTDGTVTLELNNDAGLTPVLSNEPFTDEVYTIDITDPRITSIVRQNPATSPTNADALVWDVTFDETVSNVDATDFSATGTTATVQSAVDQGSNVYRVTVSGGDLASLDATVTLGFDGAQNIADPTGNALTNLTPTGTNDNTFVVDNTEPRITSIVRQSPSTSPTNADALVWDVTFDGTVTNVDATDFSATGTTATVQSAVDQGSNVYRVTVSGGDLASLDATVTLGFDGAQNIDEPAGNALTNLTPTGTNDDTFVVDNTEPRITDIVRQSPGSSPTNASTLVWDVTFDGTVNNVDATDFSATGTTATVQSAVDQGSNVYRVTVSGGDLASLDATVTLGFDGAQDISDPAGNALTNLTPTGTNDNTFVVDNIAPRITSIVRQSPATSPTNADALVWDVTFDETVNNVGGNDFSVTGTTATVQGAVDQGSNVYRVTVSGGDLAGLDATVTLGIDGGQDIDDALGNALSNFTPTGTNDNTYVVDNTIRISSIVRQSPATSPTNADALVWDVTFDGTVTNVDATDFSATGTTATVQSAVDQGSNVYRVTVSGGDLASLNGTVTLGFDGAQNIDDPAGNALANLTPTGTNDNTFVVDNIAPRITSIVRQSPASSPTNASTLVWDVTFNGTVNNVDATDFSVTGTTATVQGAVDQGSNVYRVSVSGGDLASLDATVTLGFDGAQDIADLAGNALTNLTPTGTNNNNFVVDNIPPRITSIVRQSPATSPTNADALVWDVTFDGTVNNVDATDFSATGTTATVQSAVDQGGNAYRVTVSGGDLAGLDATVTLGFDGAQDIADPIGNALSNFTPTGTNDNTFVVDNTIRISSIVRQNPATSPTNADALVWDVTFDGTVNNVDATDFSATGTTATVQSAVDQGSNVYRVTVSGGDLASLDATVTLGFDGAQNIDDPAGNALTNLTPTGTNDNTFIVDNAAPRITSIVRQNPATSPTNADALVWDVTFDGTVNNVDATDFSATGTTATVQSAVDQGSNVYRVTVSGGDLASLDATVTLGFDGAQDIADPAGNALTNLTPTGTNDNTFVVDNTEPRITSIVRQSPATSPTNADALVWDVTFDETVNNVDATDFSATGTTATVQSAVDQGSNVFRVTVSGGDLAGLDATVTLGFDGAQDIDDPAGNALTNLTPTGTNDNTFVVDNSVPITSIVRQSPATSPTNADALVWDVTFSEAVSNVDATDFSATGTTATVQSAVDQGSNVYRVTVSGGDLAGLDATVTLGFDGAQDIVDALGNALTNFTPTGTNDNTFVVDNTQPQATVTTEAGPIYTLDLTMVVTVSYPESMDNSTTPTISFGSSGNFTGAAGVPSTFWSTNTFTNDTYTRTYTHDGSLEEVATETAVVTAGGATDLVGNTDFGDTSSPTFLLDTQPPTLSSFQYFPDGAFSNSNRDVITAVVSEEITLDGTSSPFPAITINNANTTSAGFHVEVEDGGIGQVTIVGGSAPSGLYDLSYNNYQNDDVTRPVGHATSPDITSTRLIHLEGANNGAFDGDGTANPILSYVTGGGIVDLAGNQMATTLDNVTFDGDNTQPIINADIVLSPNGTSPETIVINFNEVINLLDLADVTGFTVANLLTAKYDLATNTVILTSNANGDWNLSTTVGYTNGTGNVADGTGNEMATINITNATSPALVFETIPPGLTVLTIASNNTNPIWAKGGEQIVVTITVDDGLDFSSLSFTSVQSGGVAIANPVPVFSPMTNSTSYTATFTIVGGDTGGTFTFNLDFMDEAGNAITTLTNTDITGGSQVTVDNIAPSTPTIALNDGDDTGQSSTDDITNQTTNLTLEGAKEANTGIELFAPGSIATVTLDGSTSWSTDVALSEAIYSITAVATDGAGNQTSSTAFGLNIDTTPPQASAATLLLYGVNNNKSAAEYDTLMVSFNETLGHSDMELLHYLDSDGDGAEVNDPNTDLIDEGACSCTQDNDRNVTKAEYRASDNTVLLTAAHPADGDGNIGSWPRWDHGDEAENDETASGFYYTQVGGTNGGGGIFDIAGNELIAYGDTGTGPWTFDLELINGDASPPEILPNVMTLYPRGNLPDSIVFVISDPLNIASGTVVSGFSSSITTIDGPNSKYEVVADDNIIYLLSSGNYDWTNGAPAVTIGYLEASGNIENTSAGRLADIVTHAVIYETDLPSITSLTITSNNADNTLAKDGDIITVAFTADDGLDYTNISFSSVQSGGVAITNAPSILPTTDVFIYTATFLIDDGDTDGAFTFALDYTDEAGNAGTQVTHSDITAGSQVTVDNTHPTVNSIVMASTDPHNAGINAGSVNFTVTFDSNVNNVDITDFDVVTYTNLTVQPTVASVNATTGTVFTVTVNTFDLNDAAASGTLNLDIDLTGTLVDDAGNDIVSAVVSPGADETYTVINPQPAEDIASLTSSAQTTTSIIVDWTNSITNQIAYQHLILVKETGSFLNPGDGTFISNDLDLTTGRIGQMAINVAHGVNQYEVTGLNSGTSYDFEIYPYTNDGTNVNYKTDVPEALTEFTSLAMLTTVNYVSSPTTISSLTTTKALSLAQATPNFAFTIFDDGGEADDDIADNALTEFTQLRFTPGAGNDVLDWTTVIAGAQLTAEGQDLNSDDDSGNVTITSNEIIFSGIVHTNDQLGEIDDDENKSYTLHVWLLSPMADGVDNVDLVFELDASDVLNNLVLIAGSSEMNGSADDANSVNGNNAIDIDVTQLVFSTEPTDIGVGANFAPPLLVTAEDVRGNRDIDYTATVNVSVNGTLAGFDSPPTTFPTPITTGLLNFVTDFSLTTAGTGQIIVTDVSSGLPPTPATSTTITASIATKTTIATGTTAANISSLAANSATPIGTLDGAALVYDFTITDDVGAVTADNDTIPTQISLIKITPTSGTNDITWADAVQTATLSDGINELDATVIDNTGLTFSGIPSSLSTHLGYVPDDLNKTYSLYIVLKGSESAYGVTYANDIDNQNFDFEILDDNITIVTNSSDFTGTEGETSGVVPVDVDATDLQFESQPSNTFINEIMTTVTIDAVDAHGTRDVDYGANVTIASTGTPNAAATATVASGTGNTSNIVHTVTGTNLTLTATDDDLFTPLNQIVSSTFDIDPGSGESDVTASSFTYNADIPYETFVSVSVANTDPKVFQFDINDGTSGGSGTDADILETNVISLSFDIVNSGVLKTVGLFDNSNAKIDEVSAGTTITFNFGVGSELVIPDNGTTTYHLRATFNDISGAVTDNTQFSFTVSGAVADGAGSFFESTNGARDFGSAATSSVSGADNQIEVLATKFTYTTAHPSSVSIDTPYGLLGPGIPVVEARDSNDNLDLDFDLDLDAFTNNSAALATDLGWTEPPRDADGSDIFVNGVFTYPTDFEFDEDSQGNTDVIITMTTNNSRTNSDGDTYVLITADTPGFEVSAAESSLITLNGSKPNHNTFDYILFDSDDFMNDTKYDTLANFLILDEDVVGTFNPGTDANDLAPSNLAEITVHITNWENIKRIAIHDGTTIWDEQVATGNVTGDFTFTGLNISAIDVGFGGTGSAPFSIIASYASALQAPLTDDGEELQISFISVISGGGSKFDDTDDTGNNDAGGSVGAAITVGGSNIFNVLATQLDYTIQPSSIEGINVATQEPKIRANDLNGSLDEDFAFTATVISGGPTMTNVPTTFGALNAGTLDFPGFQYTSTGDGTLSVTANAINQSSTPVDVIHTTFTNLDLGGGSSNVNNGISTQGILPAGAVNRAIIGFDITAAQTTVSEPTLNELTIRFGNPITGVLENLRIFRSVDTDFTTVVDNTDLTGGLTITPGLDFINITGFTDAMTSSASDRNYFLVVDISQTSNFSTPGITPQLTALGLPVGDAILTSGSVEANINGRFYQFDDINVPEIFDQLPTVGDPNFPQANLIELEFNEKVIPQRADSLMINIYQFLDDFQVGSYKIDKTLSIDSTRFFFDTSLAPLTGDTKYYILIEPGVDGVSGFLDKTGNAFGGLSDKNDWPFTTSDTTPPEFAIGLSPEVTYITDVGFDLKVALNELGKIYYIVVDPDVTTGDPLVSEIRNATFPGTLVSGSADIIKEDEYHYVSIFDSNVFPTPAGPDPNFRVWVTAEDISLPTPNEMAEGTEISVDDTFTSALGMVTVLTTTEDICLGDPQIALSPINIVESADGDFTGSNQTINFLLSDEFSFDVTSTTAEVIGQGGDITIDNWTYLNNSVLQIEYSVSGTSNRDKIILSNLAVQADPGNSVNTMGTLVRLGGTGLTGVFPDLTLIAEYNTSQIPVVTFTTDPSSTTIGNDEPTVALIPDQSNPDILLGIGTSTFTGEGVVGDTLYTSGIELNVPKDIVYEYKDDFGCTVSFSKSITIFDADQAIAGLDNIQCTDGVIDLIEFTGRAPQFLLIDLQVAIQVGSETAFNNTIVQSSLTLNGSGDYEFDPGVFNTPANYALFSLNDGGLVGQLVFTGQYQDQQNTLIIETLDQTVDIYIPPVSTLLFTDQGAEFADEYCEDDGNIRIEGFPKPSTGSSTGEFNIYLNDGTNLPDNTALTDNGDGSAIIDAGLISRFDHFDVTYSFQSLVSGCDSTITETVRMNPNPIATFTNIPGCVDAVFNFEDTSEFSNGPSPDPATGSIIDEWIWNFDDLDNSDAGAGNPDDFSGQAATHTFQDDRTYNVTLFVTSDRGCISATQPEPISIGENPVTSFDFEQIGLVDNTIFTNTTPSQPDPSSTVESLTWTVDRGTSITYVNGLDIEFGLPYEHDFVIAGIHEIILTATSDKNCAVNDTLSFFTVPEYTVDNSGDYEEDFDDAGTLDDGGWIAWGTNSSWGVGTTGGVDDISESPDKDNFWVTGVGSIYNANEASYVYSPVFDITNLDRPMIKFQSYFDINPTKDGALIEYTVQNTSGDSKNGIDDSQWSVLGLEDSGEAWYDENSISNVPGNEVGNFGWSQQKFGWNDSKHSLSGVKQSSGNSKVQFRVAFESGNDANTNFDGMAFDNVLVGQRTRIVLVENFSSTADASGRTAAENTYINDTFSSITNEGTEVVIINYHTDHLGYDPLNEPNATDPNARATYYGISSSPRAIIDGTIFDATNPNNFEAWGAREFNLRSLNRASFVVDITLSKDDGAGEIIIDAAVTRKDNVAQPETVLVNVAILEDSIRSSAISLAVGESIASGENYFEFILRKMLPNAGGVTIPGSDLVKDVPFDIPQQRWVPASYVNIDDLSVVVFLQDEDSKEVYQANKVEVTDIPTQVTGTDLMETGAFTLYPNPAQHYTTLDFGRLMERDYQVKVYDQFGKQIFTETILSGTRAYELDTKNYLNGMYFIQVESDSEILERTKLVIMDK